MEALHESPMNKKEMKYKKKKNPHTHQKATDRSLCQACWLLGELQYYYLQSLLWITDMEEIHSLGDGFCRAACPLLSGAATVAHCFS